MNRDTSLRQLDVFFTEDREQAQVSTVCVVVGTAGVGKTSYAIHWAHGIVDEFPDGQLFVNLRGYDPGPPVAPDQVLERFLSALGVPHAAIPADLESRADLYRSQVAGRRVLIVLDNASSVRQVRPLLPGSPGCLVLVTSRSRLSGLVARDGARRLSLDMLNEMEAISLIRSLINEYRPKDDPTDIAELVHLCARLPLALRIAAENAARRPQMPLGELIGELRDESALWDALATGDDEEADAVRSVFAWSYRALTDAASRLFRLLGVHPGADFSSRAAAALADIPLGKARRLLDDLVGAHLLEQQSSDRYSFHDLLRAYAVDQVRDEEDPSFLASVLRRLLLWYLRQAAAAAAIVIPGTAPVTLASSGSDSHDITFPDYHDALHWYEQERSNLIAATQSAAEAGFHDIAWQLPVCVYRIYARYNDFDDWRITSTYALASVRTMGNRGGEALVLESLAKLHTQSHDLPQAIEYHGAALAIRRELSDRLGEISSLNGVGLAMLRAHRPAEAKTYFSETYALAIASADREWQAIAANALAYAHVELEELGHAESRHEEAVALFREFGDRASEGDALRCASQIHRSSGRLAQALASVQSALAIAMDFDNRVWEAWWLIELGQVQAALGKHDEAVESYHRSGVLHRRIGDRNREACSWDATGVSFLEQGQPQQAAEFHRQAANAFRTVGNQWQLALASANLATALAASHKEQEALISANDAQGFLTEFEDPAAKRLLARVRTLLSSLTP
ncbi:tetratricopeptide (TPR) repeat protein [Catenulispora sp. GP43]|uniref:ATP-binding protein n=1 Tax=Catenulispora sp. GP43 TaxID=3156263 RepID=UPI0035167397